MLFQILQQYQALERKEKQMISQSYDRYEENIAIIIITLNIVSMTALILVLLVYIVNWKSIASFPMRLSFYLCLACLGQNITVLLLNPISLHQIQMQSQSDTSWFCVTDGFLKVVFDMSSIIWTTLIIYSVYTSIITKIKLQKMEIPYILIAFIVPAISACIPIFLNLYQFDIYSCWFKSQYTTIGFWLRMGYFFIPLWIMFIVNTIFSILTYRELKKIQLSQQLMTIFKRIVLFPLIIFICGIFATIDVFYSYINKSQLLWLQYVSLFLLNSYGFFNAIAYGLNPIIRQRIIMCFRKDNYRISNSSDVSKLLGDRSSRNSTVIQAQLLQLASIKRVYSSQNSRVSQS